MFENLKKFEISQSLYWLDMPELGPKARILLAPAGEANPAFQNAMMKMSGSRIRALAKSQTLTVENAQQSRDEDRVLFPLFVIKSWENLEGTGDDLDENGHVPFSRENARKLCKALPNHLMDDMRNEAATPSRFYAEDEIAPPDAEELAKN